jgi:hypothetical protein
VSLKSFEKLTGNATVLELRSHSFFKSYVRSFCVYFTGCVSLIVLPVLLLCFFSDFVSVSLNFFSLEELFSTEELCADYVSNDVCVLKARILNVFLLSLVFMLVINLIYLGFFETDKIVRLRYKDMDTVEGMPEMLVMSLLLCSGLFVLRFGYVFVSGLNNLNLFLIFIIGAFSACVAIVSNFWLLSFRCSKGKEKNN